MVGTKHDKLGLTKDGKTFIGPICPWLLAQQGRSRGDGFSSGGFRQTGGYSTGRGGGTGPSGSPYGQWRTNTFIPNQKESGGRGAPRGDSARGRGGRGKGKENRPQKGGTPTANGAAAAAQP
jgi:hypothetical protein